MVYPLSWNGFLSYRNCPLRYKNIYILKKDPTVIRDDYFLIYGSIIHDLVEFFYKREFWKLGKTCGIELEKLAKEYFRRKVAESSILWGKPNRKDPKSLLKEILGDIPKVLNAIKKYKLLSNDVRVELNLRAKLSNFEIGGRLDLILTRKNGLTLIEGKGSKNRDLDHREQLLYYALSYYLSKKELPKYNGVWYFREEHIEWFSFKIEDLKILRDKIINVRKGIDQKKFEPTKEGKHCFWCEYKNTCQVNKEDLNTPFGKIVQAEF